MGSVVGPSVICVGESHRPSYADKIDGREAEERDSLEEREVTFFYVVQEFPA